MVVALTVVASLVAASCGDDSEEGAPPVDNTTSAPTDDTTPTESAPDQPGDGERCAAGAGGQITMGVFSPTAVVDPLRSTQGVFGAIPVIAVYDSLMQYDPIAGEYSPRVAESLTPNDDLSEWQLTLRPGITFGNGDPLDAAAVKASVERHQDPDNSSLSGRVVSQIVGMEVVDDLTLVFSLSNPNGQFPSVLASETGMIVNTAVAAADGEAFGTVASGAGVGPFEIERLADGEELVLSAKDDYWGGEVCLDSVRFVSVPGAQATYESFGLGELDVAFLREPGVVADARDDGVESFTNLRLGGDVIFINTTAPDAPLDDVRVRQAIVQAIDENLINERVYGGDGIATRAIASPGSLLYDGVDGPAYDPDAARALLAEVVAETGWDGHLKLQCQTVPDKVEVGIAVKGMLDSVGFDVEIEQGLGIGDWVRKVNVERNYELACGGSISIDQAHPATNLESYRSDNALNYLNWTSATYDDLLGELRAATEAEAQADALGRIQELWNEEVPALVYNNVEEMIAWGENVSGLDFSLNTMVLFDQATVAGS